MTYQTHAYFGAELFRVLSENWDIPLSKKRLVAGSVKPDVSSLFIRHPHFWKYSRRYVCRKIRKLMGYRIKPDGKNKRFSEDLGIVLHYVADFFTAVHNISPNRLKAHLEFEDTLYALFREHVSADTMRTTLRLVRGGPSGLMEAEYPERILKSLHRSYIPAQGSPLQDVGEITRACLTIAACILDSVAAARDLLPVAENRSLRAVPG